jgi:ABC-type branched-subunit amino acid transport system permease subunit
MRQMIDGRKLRFLPATIGLNHASYAAFAAVAIAWAFVAADYWVFITTATILLAISTLGLTVVVGWAREVSLMQAGLTGTAVYLGGYAYRQEGGWGLPFLVAAAFAIGVVVLLSVLVSLATAKLSGIYIMVLTLGLQMTIERSIFAETRLTGGISALHTPRPRALGISFTGDRAFYFLCLAMLGLAVLVLVRLRSSRHGQALVLVGTDRQAAASVGISPWRYKIFAFAVAGFFAGVAGVLTAPLFGTPPAALTTYFSLNSLFYLAIPVLAGFQSLFGVVLVAAVFGLAPQALEPFRISPLLLGGVGLLLGTLAGRAGVSGLISDQLRARRRRRATAGSTEMAVDAPAVRPGIELGEAAVYATAGSDER